MADATGADAARLEQLRRQIRETRAARMDTERRAVGVSTLEAAIAAAERDRDAGTSPALEEARRRAELLAGRLAEGFEGVDRIMVFAARLATVGFDPRDDTGGEGAAQLMARLDADAQTRAEITALLAGAGIDWTAVPDPPGADRRPHLNTGAITQLRGELTRRAAERDAATRRSGSRRPDWREVRR